MSLPPICTYCGFESDMTRDYVIPVAFLGRRRWNPRQQWIVDACRQCNNIAGSNFFIAIPDKARFIKKRFLSKFAKVLRMPMWTKQEIDELGYVLRSGIEETMLAKALVLRRIAHLEMVSQLPETYQRPRWLEEDVAFWKRVMKRPEKRPKRKKKVLDVAQQSR